MGSSNWADDILNQEFRHLHGDSNHQNRPEPDYIKKKKVTGKLGGKERGCCVVPDRRKERSSSLFIRLSYENVIH